MASDYIAHVLVIDDEMAVAIGVCDLLQTYNYRTDYATSGEEGLEYLQENPGTDIVLLDINLGAGMSGLEALPLIVERFKYVQVIMFTSQDALQVGVESMKKGAFDYLTKPFSEDIFFQKVPAALEKKRISKLNDLYLNILVHDLKNPLQCIMGGLDLLRRVTHDMLSGTHRELLDNAEKAVVQIEVMIDNILGISRFENGTQGIRMEKFDLRDEVPNTLRVFNNEVSVSKKALSVRYPEGDGTVTTDKGLYGRVLTNIVSNAVRFTPAGGHIQMEIKPSDGGMLQTNVTNTGSYIEEDLRATLFDKFMSSQSMNRTVRGQNFGLGLTYSKMAVEALGGRIWVDGDESVPQTTFHFTVKNHEGS